MKNKLVLLLLIMVIAFSNTKGQLKMLSNGYVGIGTTTPNNTLQVNNLIKFDDTKYSTFIGYATGTSNTGNNNSFFGYNSGVNNSSGNSSSAFGWYALYSNTTGSNNNAFGAQALKNNTIGSYNIAVGDNALLNNTLGAGNIAIGQGSLTSNISGQYNTAVGHTALYTATGSRNSAVGQQSLYSNTTGGYNTGIGTQALYSNTTGSYNTALGYYAFQSGAAYSNSMALGANAYAITASNMIKIGNNDITYIGGKVGWTVISDMRIKKDVLENVPGLKFIKELRPVTYYFDREKEIEILGIKDTLNWEGKNDIDKIRFTGFLAQEVEEAAQKIGYDFSGVSKTQALWGLKYSEFVVPIVKSIQELNTINDNQASIIDSLKNQVAYLQKQIDNCCISEKKINNQTINSLETSAKLYQNAPNPFSKETEIKCFIPKTSVNAAIYIYDMQGTQIKKLQINNRENTNISIQGSELKAGMYMYSLIIDGKEIDTKRMILTE